MSMPNGIMIQHPNGDKFWRLNGQFHRKDGPAVERATGTKAWWLNGKRHRTDGPAVVRANGTKLWYINGIWMGDGDNPPSYFYDVVVAYKKTLNSDDLTVDDLGDLL